MILLKNDGLLPLKKGSSIAVVGNYASQQHLTSDYAGGGGSYGGCWPDSKEGCIVTIAEAIAGANAGGTTKTSGKQKSDNATIAAALSIASAADTVVLALGEISTEGEGHDRADIVLDDASLELATRVFALEKPVLLVLSNGCSIALDGLIEPSNAIVEAFDPGHNTPQLAALLFGHANNWGKLPVTIYSHNYTTGAGGLPAQRMDNYDMVKAPGRGYRYYQGEPLFAFGTGLSLTTFMHSCSCAHAADAVKFDCSCELKNTGKLAGDEVIFVYDALSPGIRATVGNAHPLPIKRLVDFERAAVAAGASAQIEFRIEAAALASTTADGTMKLYTGTHDLIFSRGNGNDVTVAAVV